MSFSNAIGTGNNGNGKASGIGGFDDAQPAPEFSLVPPGIYKARVSTAGYMTTKKGDDAYRMQFTILEGEQTNRTVSRIWTFGAKALPYTKRDLAAFGLTTSKQLLSPYPPVGKDVMVRLVVALQRGDDGIERNDIKRIDVLEIRDVPGAEYLLDDDAEEVG